MTWFRDCHGFGGVKSLASPYGATEQGWRQVAGKPLRGYGTWPASSRRQASSGQGDLSASRSLKAASGSPAVVSGPKDQHGLIDMARKDRGAGFRACEPACCVSGPINASGLPFPGPKRPQEKNALTDCTIRPKSSALDAGCTGSDRTSPVTFWILGMVLSPVRSGDWDRGFKSKGKRRWIRMAVPVGFWP
jgi:hypothetical protein